MTVNESLEIVTARDSRPYEDDWELIEAAEVLAKEVTVLRDLGKRAQALLTECIMHGMPITEEVADVRNNILNMNR